MRESLREGPDTGTIKTKHSVLKAASLSDLLLLSARTINPLISVACLFDGHFKIVFYTSDPLGTVV